ncbi:MAG: hypothetical protein ACTIL2_01045 [Corynebacterium sp.]|uniref:hypothetical protein n=1 Tax=Corynebacterium sp. TaxID=1720 RepID=UPI003F9452AD
MARPRTDSSDTVGTVHGIILPRRATRIYADGPLPEGLLDDLVNLRPREIVTVTGDRAGRRAERHIREHY